MSIIIDHNFISYKQKRRRLKFGYYNGAYYYSIEIVKNIIPAIKTKRNWITINLPGVGIDNSIVFIHNNLHPEHYNWLCKYKNLILVCSNYNTIHQVRHIGKAVYLPLSVDVKYVEKFKKDNKIKDAAYAGRLNKPVDIKLPVGTDMLGSMPREQLLDAMSEYRNIYAVGRTAIEAKILGCQVLPYDNRYLDPSIWKILDNKHAADILQTKLDEIDGGYR